jgi:hypothetical protein
MDLNLTFDLAVDRREPTRLGPFASIRLEHRRLWAGDEEIIRHVDGAWHIGEAAHLRARVTPVDSNRRGVTISFTEPWGRDAPTERSSSADLYGDRLLLGSNSAWAATDDDEGRCWVSERTGLANRALIISGA